MFKSEFEMLIQAALDQPKPTEQLKSVLQAILTRRRHPNRCFAFDRKDA